MSGLFSAEGRLFQVMSKIGDMIILNFFWLVGCLGIVTIGPSTAALYHCCIKCIRRDRSKIGKEFWHSWRINLKQGIPLTILLAVVVFVDILYVEYAGSIVDSGLSGSFRGLMYFLGMVVYTILVCALGGFLFPLLSRFNVKFGKLLEMDVFMSVRHIFRTLIAGLLVFFSIYFTLGAYMMVLFVPSVVALITTFLYEPILIRYMPRDFPEGTDNWYFEGEEKKAEKKRQEESHAKVFRQGGKKG